MVEGEALNDYSFRNVQKTVAIRLSGLPNSNNLEMLLAKYRNTTNAYFQLVGTLVHTSRMTAGRAVSYE